MRPIVKLWETVDFSQWIQVPIEDQSMVEKPWLVRFLRIIDFTQWWQEPRYVENFWDRYYVNNDDLSMVRYGATTWFICSWMEWIIANNLFKITPKKENILKKYLYVYFKSPYFDRFLQKEVFWAAMPAISFWTLKNFEIPLPPLETQKAIVAKLDQIFAELNQTKSEIQKNLDNTDELRKSALNQTFQGDWEMKKLGDCVKINNWYVLTEFDENWKYACIKVWDMNLVENNPFITTSEHWINEYKENRIVEENSIIFPKRWAAIATNKKRLNKIPCYIDNNCMAISIKDNAHILPMFLFTFMQWFDLSTISNSAGIPLINNNDIWGVIIPVPPLSEQEKIVEHLDQVSKEVKALKSQYQSQLDNLEELKKSVLDKAFRWELGE